MHKLAATLLLICLLINLNAQNITSIGEGYQVKMSPLGVDETRGQIAHVQNGFLFTSPTMNNYQALQCLNQTDLEEVWKVQIEKKWEFQNLELVPDTTLFLKNGAIAVIAVHYSNKDEAIIYGRIFDADGKELETRKLTSLVARNKKDIQISALVSNNNIVIHSISNLNTESSRIFQAVWIDENFKEVKKQKTELKGPQLIENFFYDAPRNALYISTYPKSEKTLDFSKKEKYVIRFRKDEMTPIVEAFKFEDFDAVLLAVTADTATGKPYIFGLAENKLSDRTGSTFVMALNPETLKDAGLHFFPISKEVVDRIRETRIFTTIYESSRTVNLEVMKVEFTKDYLIVIYENIDINPEYGGLKSHLGQYVLRYSADLKEASQLYVANFGYGNSKSLIDDAGNVRIFFLTSIKKFNKANPTLPQIEVTRGIEEIGCFEAKIDDLNKISYQNIFVFKPDNKTVGQKINLLEVQDGKANCYVMVSTYYFDVPTFIRAVEN